jgi:hypothetical protein
MTLSEVLRGQLPCAHQFEIAFLDRTIRIQLTERGNGEASRFKEGRSDSRRGVMPLPKARWKNRSPQVHDDVGSDFALSPPSRTGLTPISALLLDRERMDAAPLPIV